MEPVATTEVAVAPVQQSNLFRLLPSEIVRVILAHLHEASDAAYLGATSKSMRKLVMHPEAWQDRLKLEYNGSFSRLTAVSTPSNSPLWYMKYAKIRLSHRLLSREEDSYKPTKVFDVQWQIRARQGSVLGRSLYPTLVDCGQKIIIRSDRLLRVLDAATGKVLKTFSFQEEIGNIRPVREILQKV
jgi:hypothetical protein